MSNHGIDYGMGKVNVDSSTGIRYGVISQHSISGFALDDFEPDYPEQEEGEDTFVEYEPLMHILDDGQYYAQMHTNGDIFILKSPYYTHAQYCSPCAPGTCHLDHPVDETGPRAYCLGSEFFEREKAPYHVYRISDGSLVEN